MTIAGNICLGLACLIFLLLLAAQTVVKSAGNFGDLLILAILALLLFILFSVAFCAIASKTELDWLGWSRRTQKLAVVLSCLGLAIIIGTSAAFEREPYSQMPVTIRPFVPWAHLVLPVVLIAVGFLWLNKDPGGPAGQAVPVLWLRSVFAGLSALSFLAMLSFVGESIYWSQWRAVQQVASIQNRQNDRDRMIMEQTQSADPEKDFGSLLNQTTRFEKSDIRKVAVDKILSNRNFTELLIAHLRDPLYCEEALIFLRDNEPPDRSPFGEPIREAFILTANNVRGLMRTEVVIHTDSFVYETSTVLEVVDKFGKSGVDYLPAIRQLRAAMDEPRSEKVELEAKKTLDEWLAKKGK
jgi:hypothetical protein